MLELREKKIRKQKETPMNQYVSLKTNPKTWNFAFSFSFGNNMSCIDFDKWKGTWILG